MEITEDLLLQDFLVVAEEQEDLVVMEFITQALTGKLEMVEKDIF